MAESTLSPNGDDGWGWDGINVPEVADEFFPDQQGKSIGVLPAREGGVGVKEVDAAFRRTGEWGSCQQLIT